MALLDIQAMDSARGDTRWGGGGGGGGSDLSVALCDSFASVLLCL
jgi:Lanthionine-containing peptide SapB precursor RamS